jgi:hypothetical protein
MEEEGGIIVDAQILMLATGEEGGVVDVCSMLMLANG